MTRARVQPTGRLLLGSADAVLRHPVVPPQVDVLPQPPNAAVVHQAVLPQPPVAAAEVHQRVNNQAAEVPPLEATPPPAVNPTAQSLATRLLALDPAMTLEQLTGILDILGPNRHTRTVASNLLRFARPPASRSAPMTVSATSHPPPVNPLTGPRIVTPQRRAQPAPDSVPARSLLDLLSTSSRKRSVLHHPTPAPRPTLPLLKHSIQIP